MALIKMVPLEEEIKNNPELRMADIESLRNWYQKQPHLPKISDKELALFLHSNYYLLEPTKVTLDNYFTIRTHVPEFFSNRDPVGDKDIRQTMAIAADFILKSQTKEGYDIMFAKITDSDASKYNYNANIKYFQMVCDHLLYTRPLARGQVLLIDMHGVTFGHAGRLSPLGLKKFLVYLQEGMPIRLKAMHFVNTSAVMDLILNMMKPFMKKELMDMLHMHTSLESLSKYIDIDILPNECGGKAGPIMSLQEEAIKTIEEHRAWFIYDQENNRVKEALRPGKSKNEADLFGVEGSFKKLDID